RIERDGALQVAHRRSGLEATLLEVRTADEVIRLGAVRALVLHLEEERQRLLRVADRDVRRADVKHQIDVVRELLRGALELLERLLHVAGALEEDPALERD